jgi:hypothetical protein
MAARYWVNGGNGNWNSTTNWSATSGGSSGASVPTSSDDVFFDSAGNSNSTISATITILSLTIDSGYTATMTHNAVLTIAGNWDFSGTYTIAGTGAIVVSATSTITSGQSWPNNLTFSNSNTKTLATNLVVLGSLTLTFSVQINSTTSETISCNGIAGTGNVTGTATIILTGGVWSNTSTIGVFNNLTLKPDNSNITFGTNVYYGTGTITYTASTYAVDPSGSTLNVQGCTFNTNGMSWNNISNIATSNNLTINSLLTILGTFRYRGGQLLGTHGFICHTFLNQEIVASTITLKESITYTITNLLSAFSSRTGSVILFTSSSGTNRAFLTLQNGAECRCLANFTRIDASGGRPIRSFNGVITDSPNVVSITDLRTVASAA